MTAQVANGTGYSREFAAVGALRTDYLDDQISRLPQAEYQNQITFLESVLEQTQALIRMLDMKAAVFALIACALAATIVLHAGHTDAVSRAGSGIALALLALCIAAAARAVFPRLSAGANWLWGRSEGSSTAQRSPHFFAHIAEFDSPAKYLKSVIDICDHRAPRMRDLAQQVYAVSGIALSKTRLIGVAAIALQAAVAVAAGTWVWQVVAK